MHDEGRGGVAQGGGQSGRACHSEHFLVQKSSAQSQSLAHRGVALVGRTKGYEMNYRPELLPPKFRHPFA